MDNKPFTPYVYRVTNKITGQFYIGMKATSNRWNGFWKGKIKHS